MTKNVSVQFFAILLSAFVFAACSKDDDDNDSPNTPNDNSDTPAEVSDPASLDEGQAEFAAAGNESFSFTNATSSWNNSGVVGFSGRQYAQTTVTFHNEADDVQLNINFYVHDPEADIDGGELPEAGSFDFSLSLDELEGEDTESYAEVSVYGSGLEYGYSDSRPETDGSIVITSFDNGVIEGSVSLTNLTNSVFDNEEAMLNLAASFKALEG